MITPMGVMYEYFAAPSDDAASAMLDDSPSGPGPEPPSPELAEAKRTGDPEAVREAAWRQLSRLKVRESASGTLVLRCKGIDHLVPLIKLEELLTGTPYDEIADWPRFGEPVAIDDFDTVGVWPVRDELQTALTNATDDQLIAVVAPWSRIEEFWGDFDPDILTEFVRELAVLARSASERGERLYCWVC